MTYQDDRKNATRLISDALQEGFIQSLNEYYNRSAIIDRYNFSSDFRQAFLTESIRNWEELLAAISRIMKRFYPSDDRKDNLGTFRYRLIEQGFSDRFVTAFDRVANKQIGRQSDVLIMHFSQDVSLRDLVQLEDSINKMYFEYVAANEGNPDIRQLRRISRFVRVRKFTHPGSSEIFLDPYTALALIGSLVTLGTVLTLAAMSFTQRRIRRQAKLIVTQLQSQETELTSDHGPTEINVEENFPPLEMLVRTTEPLQKLFGEYLEEPSSSVLIKSGDHVIGLENTQ